MAMSHLGNILKNYQPNSPLRKSVTAAMVVETANTILKEFFGPEVETMAQATYVKHRTLYVASLSTTASQAIKMRENELFKAIKERLGGDEVARIQFVS